MNLYNNTCYREFLLNDNNIYYNKHFGVDGPMKPGETMNISNQSFIFNSTGIKNNKKMNFRIKSETYGRD
jgi:hypothetical protein